LELACLAGQPAWLPAASTRLACSESGRDEQGALWSDSESGSELLGIPELRVFWTPTCINPGGLAYQAVLLCPELAVGTLDLSLERQGGGTAARFELSITAISEAGSARFDEGLAGRMERLLSRFGRRLADAVASGTPPPVVWAPQQARRQGVTHQMVVDGPIDTCFSLACPVAELQWIDDWHFDLIYSESGRNETGCVFLEPGSALAVLRCPGVNNYWYTTRYDAERYRFEAVWMTRDLATARWSIQMTDLGGGQTRICWSLVYTGLSPEGSRIIAEPGLDGRMEQMLDFLATSLKRYVESGTIYRLPGQRKLRLAASLVGAALGRHVRRRRDAASLTNATPA
jgi:hypothetical protein